MGEHTSGPWSIEDEDIDEHLGYLEPHIVAQTETGDVIVAIVRIGLKGTQANGRLIAAAPELLEACKVAVDWITDDPCSDSVDDLKLKRQVISRVHAAIQKAEAEL